MWVKYQKLASYLRCGTATPEFTLTTSGTATGTGSSACTNTNTNTNTGNTEDVNILKCKPSSDHALAYIRVNTGYTFVGLATSDTELYCKYVPIIIVIVIIIIIIIIIIVVSCRCHVAHNSH